MVKKAFNQRRKVMRNSLKEMIRPGQEGDPVFMLRPEQLGVDDFIRLTGMMRG
jgi:16S rRNA (adenine1518-N6/adenine1519-N6)-dimethyltransferase